MYPPAVTIKFPMASVAELVYDLYFYHFVLIFYA